MVGSAPVSIDEVVRGVPERCEPRVYGDRDPTLAHIEHITHDSRQVRRGSLFACIPGAVNDGHTFARQAVSNGAVALLVDRPVDEDVPQLVVKSVRESLGWVAASVYRHPSRELTVVGVTGTNGKTTTTHMVTSIARAAGLSAEPIGTLSGARTTPEATDLQATLRQFVDDGVQLAAIEVSSHGLDQNRVDGMIFDASVFTNLTVDHLDYHQTMEAYFEAKALLFTGDRSRHMVVNSDDEYGRRLIASIGNHAMAYSLADADQLIGGPNGSTFVWRDHPVEICLGGTFNVSNALGAATAMAALGIVPAAIARGLSDLRRVDGRWESVPCDLGFAVIVDYAHTPDGLANVLRTARQVTPHGRVIVVFGCGGDRDTTKRPIMGNVASQLSDLAILTSDNPRSEDPLAIIEAVARGFVDAKSAAKCVIEIDRRQAIERAIDAAQPNDIVLIAGKGHERTQTIADAVVEFDDRVTASNAVQNRSMRTKK